MSSNVVLTIGLPVFNDVLFIEQTLHGILNQTFKDFILVISDDCATDGSSDICMKYAQKDARIKYIRQQTNVGISRNMQFLLSQAETEFFMWAGDDDLYDEFFIEKLIKLLKQDNKIVSAFCDYATIDDNNKIIEIYRKYDYTESNTKKRLQKFIKYSNDTFGYGIFRTNLIKDVEFPIWWWPNKNTPYNNIYPTLCFYLTKGNYVHINEILFYKREKSETHTHHILIGKNNAIKESFAYWIRKFNLVFFSLKMIKKANSFLLAIKLFPVIFYYWFLIPSVQQLNLAFNSFLRNRLKLIK